jgi:hypothetical protein
VLGGLRHAPPYRDSIAALKIEDSPDLRNGITSPQKGELNRLITMASGEARRARRMITSLQKSRCTMMMLGIGIAVLVVGIWAFLRILDMAEPDDWEDWQ